jgi:hypothetical protein
MPGVCAGHGTELARCKSSRQVFAQPKARKRARASPRGGVWRKPNPKMRGDEQEPDTRCGTPGTSGHVTVKSSMRAGVYLINPASTHRQLSALPREICLLSARRTEGQAMGPDRHTEVSRGHSVCLAARVSGGLKSRSARGHGSISKGGGNASLAEVGGRYGEAYTGTQAKAGDSQGGPEATTKKASEGRAPTARWGPKGLRRTTGS